MAYQCPCIYKYTVYNYTCRISESYYISICTCRCNQLKTRKSTALRRFAELHFYGNRWFFDLFCMFHLKQSRKMCFFNHPNIPKKNIPKKHRISNIPKKTSKEPLSLHSQCDRNLPADVMNKEGHHQMIGRGARLWKTVILFAQSQAWLKQS